MAQPHHTAEIASAVCNTTSTLSEAVSEKRRLALASLPRYSAQVLLRESFREPETTSCGGRIYSELVHLIGSDGQRVIRELTIGEPNPRLASEQISPIAWVETDPWLTDAGGLNRQKTAAYLSRGLPVFWLHHGNQRTDVKRDKSVSRSAHQMHATLDDIALTATFDTQAVMIGGYSRGAMTAEKFIVVADQYGRSVPYSDLEAPCFARDMNQLEKGLTIVRQLPREAIGIGRIAAKVAQRNGYSGFRELAQTVNPHAQNILQELYWARALINSDVRRYTAHLPTQTSGVRTFFSTDVMSQQQEYEALYHEHPGIAVLTEPGPHVQGADPDYLDLKYARIERLMHYMQSHGMNVHGIRPRDVVPRTTV